ncbi:DUF4386 domain-containing protein [Demequina mangrovi]|uniref:DUF4386 domain-containing protein n=1 Tax=Demequina mangrovi TaxID=1043493 RepID=A0A1H7A9R6_9MICO|nr:DUF4386 domain-containing protein [Demequina mangrovi]SEJ58812.1 protein of unknown function [Demequina mangrovi]
MTTHAPAPSIDAHVGLSDRATATLVGLLYLVGTAAGTGSLAATGGGLEGPDYLASADEAGAGLAVGALLVLLMGLALALIPVVAFPVLRRVSERLAVGFVVFRGALEGTWYVVTAMTWLALFRLAADGAAQGDAGNVLFTAGETGGILQSLVFVCGATMFYVLLIRGRLVPRLLAWWGLIGAIPYALVAILGLLDVLDVLSSTAVGLQMPLALQEIVLAVWLIARGFSRAERQVEPA